VKDSVDHRRAAKTARKARYRKLLKAGGGVLRDVRVRDLNAVADVLMRLNWLDGGTDDRKQIGIAVSKLLDELADWNRTCPTWTDAAIGPWHNREHE